MRTEKIKKIAKVLALLFVIPLITTMLALAGGFGFLGGRDVGRREGIQAGVQFGMQIGARQCQSQENSVPPELNKSVPIPRVPEGPKYRKAAL